MNVLDLFSGLKGWSQAFQDRGHNVITVDNEAKFNPTICIDVMDLTFEHCLFKDNPFDIILASPPCNCFSVASIGKYWDNGRPKNERVLEAIDLVAHTIYLILKLNPKWWILENPRGMLRNVLGLPSVTTYFASWGEFVLKPTDLWGVLPKIKWKNPTKWERAPRGSSRGVQGTVTPELRAKIPYALSEAVCLACERNMIV